MIMAPQPQPIAVFHSVCFRIPRYRGNGTLNITQEEAVLGQSLPMQHHDRPANPSTAMQILLDADACPAVVKEMLYRTAQ